jgi:hypothetical protein
VKGCKRTEWDGGFLYVCHPFRVTLKGLDDMGEDEAPLSEQVKSLEDENESLIAEMDSAHGLLDLLCVSRENVQGEGLSLFDRIERMNERLELADRIVALTRVTWDNEWPKDLPSLLDEWAQSAGKASNDG